MLYEKKVAQSRIKYQVQAGTGDTRKFVDTPT